jgi:DNA-binding NarL/FixJ family response regulator
MEQRGRIIEAVGTLKKYLDGFQELVSEPDSAKRLDESLLSNRERGVLELIKIGLQNKEIDARLGISESTVKKHIVSIFSKAGVSRRAELLVPPLTSWK